jgi:hypothetical protein
MMAYCCLQCNLNYQKSTELPHSIHLKEELYLGVEVVSRESSHCLNELGKGDSSAPVRVEHREDSLHEKFVSAGHDLSELV